MPHRIAPSDGAWRTILGGLLLRPSGEWQCRLHHLEAIGLAVQGCRVQYRGLNASLIPYFFRRPAFPDFSIRFIVRICMTPDAKTQTLKLYRPTLDPKPQTLNPRP